MFLVVLVLPLSTTSSTVYALNTAGADSCFAMYSASSRFWQQPHPNHHLHNQKDTVLPFPPSADTPASMRISNSPSLMSAASPLPHIQKVHLNISIFCCLSTRSHNNCIGISICSTFGTKPSSTTRMGRYVLPSCINAAVSFSTFVPFR